jgi:hypothetical protein
MQYRNPVAAAQHAGLRDNANFLPLVLVFLSGTL